MIAQIRELLESDSAGEALNLHPMAGKRSATPVQTLTGGRLITPDGPTSLEGVQHGAG